MSEKKCRYCAMMITTVLIIVALLLSSCGTIKHYTNLVIKYPSEEDVKKHFIETCFDGDIEMLKIIANIDFEIINRVEKETIYDVYCWAELEYWEDGPTYRIGESRCYDGFVRFNKDEKDWSPSNISVYCFNCIEDFE